MFLSGMRGMLIDFLNETKCFLSFLLMHVIFFCINLNALHVHVASANVHTLTLFRVSEWTRLYSTLSMAWGTYASIDFGCWSRYARASSLAP